MKWKPFLTLLILIPILDYIWLGHVTVNMYVTGLASLGRIENGAFVPVIWPAVLVYVFLAWGACTFVLPKASLTEPWWRHFMWGGIFGLIVYGVYDFSNYSTLKDWPVMLCWADIAWGIALNGIAAVVGRWVSRFN